MPALRSALAVALSLALAVPALAQDAGPPPAPGRAVEIRACPPYPPDAGECPPVPYSGSLVDRERMGAILSKRWAAEAERDALRLSEQDARARQQAAERERDSGVGWGVLIGVTGAALVVGVVLGVVGVVVVQDRAPK